jgi:predicted metal-binding membrane protein
MTFLPGVGNELSVRPLRQGRFIVPHRGHQNPSVDACANAARSPFSLLAEAHRRAAPQAFRARCPGLRQLRDSRLAFGACAAFAAVLMVAGIVGCVLVALPS